MKRNTEELLFKNITFIIFVFFLFLSNLLHSSYIKNPNIINVGVPDYYPVIYKSYTSGADGMLVDFLKEFCQRNHYKMNFIYGNLDDLLKKLETGKLDLLFPLDNDYRKKNKAIYIQTPFIQNSCKIMVQAGAGYSTLEQLKNSKFGVLERCFIANAFLPEYKKALGLKTQVYKDVTSLMVALRHKEIEGAMLSEFKAFAVLKNLKDDFKVKIFDCKRKKINLYIGLSLRCNRELANNLNVFIKNQRGDSNSIYYNLKSQYFGESIYKKNTFLPILSFCVLGFIIILLFEGNKLSWNKILNRKCNKDIYKGFFEHYSYAVVLCDNSFKMFECNKLFLDFFCVSFNQMVNNDFDDFLSRKVEFKSKKISGYYEKVLSGETISFDFSLKYDKKDKIFTFLLCPCHDQGTIVMAEIRENLRQEKEEGMIRDDKQESLGILAAGIAHDFNNILVGITGNISLARKKSSEEKVISYLEKAHKTSLRAKSLASQLLSFSKGGVTHKQNVNLWDLVEQAKDISFSGSNIKALLYKPKGNFFVKADSNQMIQVFTNIFINAKQAMEFSGVIDVTLKVVYLNDKQEESVDGVKYYAVSVKDNGHGISEEEQKLIFNAFYSTKEKGSGLGLAVSQRIIKKHAGFITLSSELGKGSTFTIFLPASEPKDVSKNFSEISSKEKYFYKGNVMIMDDDPTVRNVLEDMLWSLGFTVYSFENSKGIIEKYREMKGKGEKIELVFLDLTLPGDIGGVETLRYLSLIDSNIKALAVSGYSEDDVIERYEDYGFIGFLSKPFSLEELENVLIKIRNK